MRMETFKIQVEGSMPDTKMTVYIQGTSPELLMKKTSDDLTVPGRRLSLDIRPGGRPSGSAFSCNGVSCCNFKVFLCTGRISNVTA